MKLAFCLFNYFPFGGLQRDFIRIARLCRDQGHEVHIFTMRWEGPYEPGMTLHLVKAQGWQNHTRIRSFVSRVKESIDVEKFDLVIGFNKMPYLDIYYAADVCYQSRVRQKHGWLHRILPRYRTLKSLEEAIFAPGKKTNILLISPLQKNEFISCYQTEENRFHILPPGISKDRQLPSNAAELRALTRQALGVKPDDFVLLLVGSGFKTKGLDRCIAGLAALPPDLKNKSMLVVIGQDDMTPYKKQAAELGVAEKVKFLGGRSDVPALLLAGDVLLHPAYHENTGTVLLEGVIAGLPVLTVDVCGYAHYVEEAEAGMVLVSPFNQDVFNFALAKMLTSPRREEWRENGIEFAKKADIYSMPERVLHFIENAS